YCNRIGSTDSFRPKFAFDTAFVVPPIIAQHLIPTAGRFYNHSFHHASSRSYFTPRNDLSPISTSPQTNPGYRFCCTYRNHVHPSQNDTMCPPRRSRARLLDTVRCWQWVQHVHPLHASKRLEVYLG